VQDQELTLLTYRERGIASNIRRYCGYWGRGF
jgi:hypothetical protein